MKHFNVIRWHALNNSWEVRSGHLDFLDLGPTPLEEKCTPAGFDHMEDSIMECQVYAAQLQRYHGDPPSGAYFVVLHSSHEMGDYFNVGVVYEKGSEKATDYAQRVESEMEHWDPQSLEELREEGHYLYTAKIININRA